MAEFLAAFQVAHHAVEQVASRFGIFRPLELFPAIPEVFENVLQPQELRFALRHFGALPFISRPIGAMVIEEQPPCRVEEETDRMPENLNSRELLSDDLFGGPKAESLG